MAVEWIGIDSVELLRFRFNTDEARRSSTDRGSVGREVSINGGSPVALQRWMVFVKILALFEWMMSGGSPMTEGKPQLEDDVE